ncbi:MAG: glycosyltransferase [Planctomycetota bacterium]|jgi:glycosyltransferase involved in cell wall biosynthesis
MKTVAILTTFYEAESGYSLIRVAETQIRMLLDHGYDPVVLVREDFKTPDDPTTLWRRETIDLRPILPALELTDKIPDDFENRVARILDALEEGLQDVDVCITHDVILQEYYQAHNIAMRRYAEKHPELLWLHWIHSCPIPNETIENYPRKGQEHRVKACRSAHAIDPLSVWNYNRMTRDLASKADLLGGEIAVVYPARLDRGKQVEKAIRLLAGVQKAGYETRLLVIDWQSQGKEKVKYADELLELAAKYNVSLHFTSRLDDACSQGVPPHVVLELMDLSNVYIHPSATETYSLTVHEAITRGKLVVLNYDLPAMRELYGDAAIYMDFGSDRVERQYHPDEQSFWNDEALRLIAEFKQNRALVAQARARREWTPQALWHEFESLLYLDAQT